MEARQLLAAARRVRLGGFSPARETLAGGYRAAYRGLGVEYEESREYVPGDDVAAMDWKVTARLGRPFIKRFREERARTLMLAVDVSRSMTAGPGRRPPLETAALAAVILAVSAAASRDRVGLVLFSDRVEAFLPPGKGPGQAHGLAAVLAGTTPAGRGTDPAPALELIAATLTHRSPVFVLSDFLGPAMPAPLGRLAARHEVTAVVVSQEGETPLPPYGLVAVTDAETGRQAVFDCGDAGARKRLAASRLREREARLAGLRELGADVLELVGDADPAVALQAFFRQRRRPGRRLTRR